MKLKNVSGSLIYYNNKLVRNNEIIEVSEEEYQVKKEWFDRRFTKDLSKNYEQKTVESVVTSFTKTDFDNFEQPKNVVVAGSSEYIQQPFSIQDFQEKIEKSLTSDIINIDRPEDIEKLEQEDPNIYLGTDYKPQEDENLDADQFINKHLGQILVETDPKKVFSGVNKPVEEIIKEESQKSIEEIAQSLNEIFSSLNPEEIETLKQEIVTTKDKSFLNSLLQRYSDPTIVHLVQQRLKELG